MQHQKWLKKEKNTAVSSNEVLDIYKSQQKQQLNKLHKK